MTETVCVIGDGPEEADVRVVLAHGASAPADSPFLDAIAGGISQRGVRVLRFEFPYMEQQRAQGTRRPPDPMPVLLDRWVKIVRGLGAPEQLVIGGKSLGGRVASMMADEAGVAGLVCLGYPFHPPGRPDRLRVEHLRTLRTPTLIVQGTRDALGSREEISTYSGLSQVIRVLFLEDGDHSFRPRVASGYTLEQHLETAAEAVAAFAALTVRGPGS